MVENKTRRLSQQIGAHFDDCAEMFKNLSEGTIGKNALKELDKKNEAIITAIAQPGVELFNKQDIIEELALYRTWLTGWLNDSNIPDEPRLKGMPSYRK